MWDSTGLECLFDLTKHFKAQTWAAVSGDTIPKDPVNIEMLTLRARYNSQRVYEIYSFTATPGISEGDIREMFETNPQFIVDWIRKNGNKIYSDYNKFNTTVKIR